MTDRAIPAAVLAHHIAILGKTGSGKTSTEKLCVEQVVADGFRVCILDSIKSDWWGITSSADGKRPGLPFKILGGPRGHVPLPSSAGAAIGQLVGSGKLPLSIIDMADFEPGGLQRFFVDFAPALMRHARGVVYLVIEEAHEFAPKEKSGVGGESMATHWAKKLATAGRSKGVRLIVATQRVQALHNAVLGSCETVIAHRLTTPADQEPVLKWMKANTDRETQDKVAASLSSLPTGTGWICSGEARIFERVAFPKFATFDNTATPTGDGDEIDVETAPVDHDELAAIIGESVKEAEANDPKALRAEIARLKAGLSELRPIAADDSTLRAEIARLGEAVARAANETANAEMHAFDRGVRASADYVRPWKWFCSPNDAGAAQRGFDDLHPLAIGALMADNIIAALAGNPPAAVVDPPIVPTAKSEPLPEKVVSRPARSSNGAAPAADIGAERRILAVLASAHPAGMTEAQWAVAAGMKRSGGTWSTYKSRLRSAGRIEQAGSGWRATASGILDVGADVEPMPAPGMPLVEYWAGRIQGAAPMLRVLARAYPKDMSREHLAAALEMSASGGTFGTYLSRLRSPGLIEVERGSVRAAKELMG